MDSSLLPKQLHCRVPRRERGAFALTEFLRSNRCAAAIAQYPSDL